MFILNIKKSTIILILFTILIIGLALAIITFKLTLVKSNNTSAFDYFLGGTLININLTLNKDIMTNNLNKDFLENNRFRRPSTGNVLNNNYDFSKKHVISNPSQLICTYYGILQSASNAYDYCMGCGTIGNALEPYPYAYDLLSNNYKKNLPLNLFIDSFKGIGHINLLNLCPILIPNSNDKIYYMVELEVLTGIKKECSDNNCKNTSSLFGYYYGIVEVSTNNGYKIENINYISEDFLCAPYHGWIYDYNNILNIIYKENLKMIDKITDVQINKNIITAYANGNNNSYKFEFIRITNGYDILLNEYILEDNCWIPTSLLKDSFNNVKLVNNFI